MQNMQNNPSLLLHEIFSSFSFPVLHLLNQNAIKSKVQCPHSISRTCLVQEFGLVFIVFFSIIITSNMIIRKVTLILLVGNKSAESSGPRSSGRYSLRFIHHDDREQMIIDHDDNDDNDTIPVSDVLHLGDDNCTSLMSKCCRANSGWLEIRKETNRKCILVPPSVDI